MCVGNWLREAGIYDDFYELAENAGLTAFLHDQREQQVPCSVGGHSRLPEPYISYRARAGTTILILHDSLITSGFRR